MHSLSMKLMKLRTMLKKVKVGFIVLKKAIAKGQLISKGPYGVFKSHKKPMKFL